MHRVLLYCSFDLYYLFPSFKQWCIVFVTYLLYSKNTQNKFLVFLTLYKYIFWTIFFTTLLLYNDNTFIISIVKYWQETKRRKHIVQARLEYDNFWRPDFCGGTNDNQYYPDCACGIPEYEFNSTKSKNNDYRIGCSRFEKRGASQKLKKLKM